MVEWILEAGLRILEQEGPPGLTVQHLAERAGVAVGSLYRYFKNKDAIIEAVYRRELEVALRKAEERQDALAGGSMEESVRDAVVTAVERHRRLHRLHPKFYEDNAARLSAATYNPEASNRARAIFQKAILSRPGEVRKDIEVELASFMMLEGLQAILRTAVESRHDILERPDLTEEMVKLFTGYVVDDRVE